MGVEVDGKKRLQLRGLTDDLGNGKIIFVVGMDWTMYVAEKVKGKFHHTSFLAGSAVNGAGMLVLEKGGLVSQITPHSGHYQPGYAEVQALAEYFSRLQVDITTFVWSKPRTWQGAWPFDAEGNLLGELKLDL